MKHRTAYLFAALLIVFAFGVGRVFQLRLNSGDIFPAYSTQRSDDIGLAALYRALGQLPQLDVSRSIRPFTELETDRSETVIFAGMPTTQGELMSQDDVDWLTQTARDGTRIVIAFAPPEFFLNDELNPQAQKKKDAEKKSKEEKKEEKKSDEKKTEDEPKKPVILPFEKALGVKVKSKLIFEHEAFELSNSMSGLKMPQAMNEQTAGYFDVEKEAPWKTIYNRGGLPILIERKFGRGSIVLAGDSYFLTNEALSRHESSALIAWSVAGSTHVVFDESHLGLVEETSIAALARRYGLGGAMLLLLGLTILYIWRRTAVFVPVIPQESDSFLEIDHTAGLESLLRRSVPASELIDTCLAEFKSSRNSERERVVNAIVKAPPYPVQKYNAAVHSLRLKK